MTGLALWAWILAVDHASGQEHGAAEGVCSEGRISEIVVENSSVFQPTSADPQLLRWAYDMANLLHVRTSETFVRSELLFEEGDCYDPFLVSGSRRMLDRYGFLSEVTVDAQEDGEGGRRVLVGTRDEWSTKIDLGLTYDDGLNLEKFQATEENLLGYGILAEVTHFQRLDELTQATRFSTPRVFGRTDAGLSLGRSRAGSFFSFGFSHPFVGDASSRSFRQSYDWSTGFFSYSSGGTEEFSHVLIPVFTERLEFAAGHRFGEPGRSTILGVSLERTQQDYSGEAEFTFAGDFDDRVLGYGDLPPSVLRQLQSRGSTRLAVHLGTRRYRFVEYVGLDAVRERQTVGLGFFAGAAVGRGFGIFPSEGVTEGRDWSGRVHASAGLAIGRSLLHGAVSAEARRESGEWLDVFSEAEFVAYGRAGWLLGQTIFFRASTGGASNTTIPYQLVLGGRDGVRSLPDFEVPGGRRVLFVLEDRIALPWPRLGAADLGLTIFTDLGRMWAGDAPYGEDSDWYGGVGFGLRFGMPAGTRNVWRPDVIFPIGAANGPPIFRVTLELNRLRSGFGTPRLARSRRFKRGPEHF